MQKRSTTVSASGPAPLHAAGVSSTAELDALVDLAAKRLALAVDVAAAKFVSGQRVDDAAREREILDWAAGTLGDEAGVARDATVAFFGDQIAANKIIQRGLLAHWSDRPEDFPGQSRSLTEDVRPALDAINRRMLQLVSRLKATTPQQRILAQAALDRRLAATPVLRVLREPRAEAANVALESLPAA
jgi:chorismate mutase